MTLFGIEFGPRVEAPPLRYEITAYQADVHARYARRGFIERSVRKALDPVRAAAERDVWAYVENVKYDAALAGGQVVVIPHYR